ALRGQTVLDFGCGLGFQTLACARAGATRAVGVESNERSLAASNEALAREPELRELVQFRPAIPPGFRADLIISQNSFEHFLEPEKVLAEWRAALAPGGRVLIGFGPPWYAPWGAHMQFFCRLPWVQVLFPERAVLQARTLYRESSPSTYREAGL